MRTRFSFIEETAVKILPTILGEYLAESASHIKIKRNPRVASFDPDLTIEIGEMTFTAHVRFRSDSSSVHQALESLQTFKAQQPTLSIPLLVVSFMGAVGKKLCAEKNTSWIDLSGNAHITIPGLHVHVEGKPNRYKEPGRPKNSFSPKSARVARWLIANHGDAFSQREIATATGLYEGYTSRIVKKLEADNLIERDETNKLSIPNPSRIIEAWREAADFSKNKIIKGHIPVRSGVEALMKIANAAREHRLHYAATGLAGAWQIDKFADFRLCSVYLERLPDDNFLDDLSFRETSKGSNVWFALPKDEGIFQCEKKVGGVTCVNPAQIYVDLKDHPERSDEAAEHLLQTLLKGK